MNFTKLTDNIYYGSPPNPKIIDLNQFKTFLNLSDNDINIKSLLNPSQNLVNIPLKNHTVLSNQEIINVMEEVSKLPQPIYICCNNGHGRSGVIAALLLGMTYCLKGAPTVEYVQQQWQKYRGSSIDDPQLLRLGSPQGNDNKFAVENFLDYYYYECLKVQDLNRLPEKSFLVYKGQRINTILFYTHNKGIVKKEKGTKKVIFDEKKEVNRKYESFSNYTEESFSVPSDPNDILNWRASENYYQSLKYTSPTAGDQEMIKKIRIFMSTSTPHQAYLLGRFGAKGFGSYMANNKHENVEKTREMIAWMKKYAVGKVRVREDWEKYKVYAMAQTLLYKSSTKDFEMPSKKDAQNGFKNCQNPKFVKLLYEIPDNTIIVEHTSRDRIWGDGGDGGLSLIGTNYLGKILTAISFVMKHGSCRTMNPYLKNLVYIHGTKKKTKIEQVQDIEKDAENRYLCMFGMGCQEIKKPKSLRWTDNEYKTMVECLNNCSIPDHLLDEVVFNLTDNDKVKYFNANPRYVEEQIKKKNWGPIMISYDSLKKSNKFKQVPEMVSSFKIKYVSNLKLYYKLNNLKSLEMGSDFNQPITLPEGLQSLSMGYKFNQPITLPEGLQSLSMGYLFNQPINLPKGLRSLYIGDNFNQPITLPEGLQSLKMGGKFNQPITLPEGLQSLKMGYAFNQPITLPEGLQSLEMGSGLFNQPITFPEGLKSLVTGMYFNQPITFPEGLQGLEMGSGFNQPITLPEGLQFLKMGSNFNQPITIPEGLQSLKKLKMGFVFNQHINLPEGLQSLEMGSDFNQPINLPEGLQSLKKLKMGFVFNQHINLPEGLQSLEMGSDFNQPITLPEGLQSLTMGYAFNQPITFPEGLQSLEMGWRFNQPINLPKGLRMLTMLGNYKHPTLPEGLQRLAIGGDFNQPITLPEGLQKLDISNNFNQPITLPKRLEYLVTERIRHLVVIENNTSFPPTDKNTLEVNDIIAFYYPGKNTSWDKKYKHPQFGNFYPVSITLKAPSWPKSITFKNAEAAFQSLKFPKQAKEFSNLTGNEAFRLKGKLSRKGGIDYSYSGYGNNWLGMKAVLEAKFKDANSREQLLASGDRYLLEHNTTQGRDNIWSDDLTGEGSNWLGLQLILLRDDILRKNGLSETKWTRQLQSVGIDWDKPPDPPRGKDAWNKDNKPNNIWQKTVKDAISKI